jgi:hypothetical protein
MGIAGSIATKAAWLSLAAIAVVFLVKKTNILPSVVSSAKDIGSTIGESIGGGISSIPIGIGRGAADVGYSAAQQVGQAGADFQNFFRGLIGMPLIPTAGAEISQRNDAPTVDNTTINQNNREYSDNPNKPKKYRISTTKAVAAASPARQAAFAVTKAKAQARAKAKKGGKKCFNTDLDMGGVNHIDYRLDNSYHGL